MGCREKLIAITFYDAAMHWWGTHCQKYILYFSAQNALEIQRKMCEQAFKQISIFAVIFYKVNIKCHGKNIVNIQWALYIVPIRLYNSIHKRTGLLSYICNVYVFFFNCMH